MQVGDDGAAIPGLVEVVEELDVGVRASDKAAFGAEVAGHLEGSLFGVVAAYSKMAFVISSHRLVWFWRTSGSSRHVHVQCRWAIARTDSLPRNGKAGWAARALAAISRQASTINSRCFAVSPSSQIAIVLMTRKASVRLSSPPIAG